MARGASPAWQAVAQTLHIRADTLFAGAKDVGTCGALAEALGSERLFMCGSTMHPARVPCARALAPSRDPDAPTVLLAHLRAQSSGSDQHF